MMLRNFKILLVVVTCLNDKCDKRNHFYLQQKRIEVSFENTHGSLYAVYSARKETEIRDEIFQLAAYDALSRPSSQTHVKIGLSIFAIDSLELKDQRLTMTGWISMEWKDPRLVWDKSVKDDIGYIFTNPDNIWKPEVIVDNALENFDFIQNDELRLRLHYDGIVAWEPPWLLSTYCEADITYYPYDEQKCAVQILSWSYTIEEVDLQHMYKDINLVDFEAHGEWEITRTRIEDKNLTEELPDRTIRIYSQLEFWVYLQRRTVFYNLNVMMPIVLVSVMVVFVFLVPAESGEKIAYVLTVFLSLAVLLTIVMESLPRTSKSISVLGLYLATVLMLSAIGIFVTIFILLMFHKDGRPNKHSFILGLTNRAAKFVCWKNCYLNTEQALKENKVVPIKNMSKQNEKNIVVTSCGDLNEAQISELINDEADNERKDLEWRDVARILDRFCFVVFLVITLLVNVSFVLVFSGLGR